MLHVLVAPRGMWTASLRGLRQDPSATLQCVRPAGTTTKDVQLHGCGKYVGCVLAEQGWGLDWVWRKMGKRSWLQVVEVPGGGPTAVEGMPTPVDTPRLWPDKGKRKAVLESEVPKRVRRCLSLAPPIFEGGPLGSNVFLPGSGCLLPSITICQGPLEISRAEVHQLQEEVEGLREDVRVAQQERNEMTWACNTLLHDRDASLKLWEMQAEEIEQLRARLTQEAVGSLTGVPGFVAPSAQEVEELPQGLHQANESESRQHEWLLHEVAAARLETLGALGLGAPDAPGWSVLRRVVRGGGAGRAGDDPKGGAGSGAFVEVDGGSLSLFLRQDRCLAGGICGRVAAPPLLEEIVQAAWELLEVEFGSGEGQGESQEGGDGSA
ncbi:hypothetical protein C0992_005384 [Termitomyces sp. T32_za158]|nr:hypothetical protein C0992_005384 [Termitomyces sp. T32_za158]